jgi:hypothetical protein
MPLHYQERTYGVTKMTGVFWNGVRMLRICHSAWYRPNGARRSGEISAAPRKACKRRITSCIPAGAGFIASAVRFHPLSGLHRIQRSATTAHSTLARQASPGWVTLDVGSWEYHTTPLKYSQ